jgi:hypothetical protein
MKDCRLPRKLLQRGVHWGFVLVFVLSCLCVGMLVPQEAEAKTVLKSYTGGDNLNSSQYTVTLYDDHTVSAVNGTAYCSKHKLYCQYPNLLGECGLNGLTNVLDIAVYRWASMALRADGTVAVAGSFRTNTAYSGVHERNSNYNRSDGPFNRLPSPNANIIAISLRADWAGSGGGQGFAVLYADGSVQVSGTKLRSSGKYLFWHTENFPCPEGVNPDEINAIQFFNAKDYHVYYDNPPSSDSVLLTLTDGRTIWVGGDNPNTSGGTVGYRQDPNQPPDVNFTSLPAGSTIYKTDNTLTFKVKVDDPPAQADQNLPTEFYLDIGGGFNLVKSFTANGAQITDGKLSAKNGTEYVIKMDKNALIPSEINKFHIRVVTTDSFGQECAKTATLNHTEMLPIINISSLPNKINKSQQNIVFNVSVNIPDTAVPNFTTEFYLDSGSGYAKVTDFILNGTPVTNGVFTAVKGTQYNISIAKNANILFSANEFKFKAVAKDTKGRVGEYERTILHYSDVLIELPFEAISGQYTLDTGGNNNHGLIQGAIPTTGIIGNAFRFNGVNDMVSFTYGPNDISKPYDNFTLEAWVKPTEQHQIDRMSTIGFDGRVGQKYVFGANFEEKNGGIGVSVGTNGISVYEYGDKNYMPALAVYNGNIGTDWAHMVVVVQNKVPRIYVNGQLKMVGLRSPRPHSYAPTKIGSGHFGSFRGDIDEVAVYNRALQSAEIQQKYREVLFMENFKITNRDNEKTVADCTFGTHLLKFEFDIKQQVNEFTLDLELPSNIKVVRIEGVYKGVTNPDRIDISEDDPIASINNQGRQIKFLKPLAVDHYRVELLLSIDDKLYVVAKSCSAQGGDVINLDNKIFELRFLDYGSLPNVT